MVLQEGAEWGWGGEGVFVRRQERRAPGIRDLYGPYILLTPEAPGARQSGGAGEGLVLPHTRQPPKGKGNAGGLRLGEMELDCLVAHGVAVLLKERYMDLSDLVTVSVCTKCFHLANGGRRGPLAPVGYRAPPSAIACLACGDDTPTLEVRHPIPAPQYSKVKYCTVQCSRVQYSTGLQSWHAEYVCSTVLAGIHFLYSYRPGGFFLSFVCSWTSQVPRSCSSKD